MLIIATIIGVGAMLFAGSPNLRPTVVGVPAYGYPTQTRVWADISSVQGSTIVVLNPASGPGDSIDPVYVSALSAVEGPTTQIFGYVDTDYGRRPLDAILAEADRYAQWYRPSGIFLDQTPSDGTLVPYLASIVTQLRSLGYQIAMNPGQPVLDRRMADLADYIVNFEGPMDQYIHTSFPRSALESPGKYWHLVYGVADAAGMESVLKRAGANGADVVFVTDRGMPNPWDGLPPYWDDEVGHVHRT
jgi:hypothetical protein